MDYDTGTGPRLAALGDLDGDGKLDLAVANWLSNTVSIFRNTSAGSDSISFASKVDFATGSFPWSVAIGDLDGDGKADLAVANASSSTVSVLRNTSSDAKILSFSFPEQTDSATIDPVNHSIDIEVVLGTDVSALVSTLTLSSGATATVNTSSQTSGTTVNDFSSPVIYTITAVDGKTTKDWMVTVTESPTDFLNYSFGEQNRESIINAINHTIDAEVVNGTDLSNIVATFTLSTGAIAEVGTTEQMNGVTLNDFSDTVTYTVTAQNMTTSQDWIVTVSIAPPTSTSFTPTSGPVGTSVTIIGANFDPVPSNNIVFFGATQATVSTAATTELAVTVPVGATYMPITVLAYGLTGYSSSPYLVTFEGKGIDASSFNNNVNFTTGITPLSVSVGDLDGDGKTDLAVSNFSSGTVSVFRNTSTGAGSISYDNKVDYTAGSLSESVSIGDLNGNGKLDLVVVNGSSNTISILRNTSTSAGVISYAPKVDYPTGISPLIVAIGDLDGDGRPDLAVVNGHPNTVSIFRNTSISAGTISFATSVDYPTGSTPNFVSIGDLDGDGKADLAVTNLSSNTVSVLRNTSTGTITVMPQKWTIRQEQVPIQLDQVQNQFQ